MIKMKLPEPFASLKDQNPLFAHLLEHILIRTDLLNFRLEFHELGDQSDRIQALLKAGIMTVEETSTLRPDERDVLAFSDELAWITTMLMSNTELKKIIEDKFGGKFTFISGTEGAS